MLGRFLIGLIRCYQQGVSSWTLPSCRFTPTCSAYAMEAIEGHGAGRGLWLAAKRLARCHPWGGCGVDPVPPSEEDAVRAVERGRSRSGEVASG